jgi:hypothetical protein
MNCSAVCKILRQLLKKANFKNIEQISGFLRKNNEERKRQRYATDVLPASKT